MGKYPKRNVHYEALQSVQKKLTCGSLSVLENVSYGSSERLSSDVIRSFTVKFPRYAETVVRARGNLA